MARRFDRKLILEDGSEYFGYGFGAKEERVLEIVFNTSMAGYQEIVSDPSYTFQGVVATYPLSGNYGVNKDDNETVTPTIGALIVSEYNDFPSNFRSERTLSDWLEEFSVPGIEGVDTRKLTRSIRDFGSRRGIITDADVTKEEGLKRIAAAPVRRDAVPLVSTGKPWLSPAERAKYKVAAIDCGIKLNILRSLNKRGCDVTVFPYDTPAAQIEKTKPDGLFLSNGPGDPEDVTPVIELVKKLKGKLPIFGICLGHQMIALAYGAKTYKLKFGHRGGNHPVKNLLTGKVEITSQNHSFAVDTSSVSGTGLEITHVNLLDNTVEGLRCEKDRVFSVQYHPESAPGPEDSGYLFDEFIELMKRK
ncbi:MAG: glutamine-hydrolyzing carbamoyl-phosphate synthase small subunit [Candidatus Scatosoma sp.]